MYRCSTLYYKYDIVKSPSKCEKQPTTFHSLARPAIIRALILYCFSSINSTVLYCITFCVLATINTTVCRAVLLLYRRQR